MNPESFGKINEVPPLKIENEIEAVETQQPFEFAEKNLKKIDETASPLISFETKLDETDESVKASETSIVSARNEFLPSLTSLKEKAISVVAGVRTKINGILGRQNSTENTAPPIGNWESKFPPLSKIEPRNRKPVSFENEVSKGFKPERFAGNRERMFRGIKSEDKEARVDEFKEKLFSQKEHLMRTQNLIMESIRKNPNIDIAEVRELIKNEQETGAFNEGQIKTIEDTFGRYQKKHEAIKNIRQAHPDDGELFNAAFGFKPEGKIEVVESPLSLAFRCFSQADFIRLYADTPHAKVLSPEMAAHMGGFRRGYNQNLGQAEIIVLNNAFEETNGKENSNDVLAHEEQHSINSLFKSNHFYKHVNLEKIKEAPQEDRKQIVTEYLRSSRESADEDELKDELLAQYKGLDSFDGKTSKEVLMDLVIVYRDRSYRNTMSYAKSRLEKAGVNPDDYNELFTEVFQNESYQMLKGATEALVELEEKGWSKDDIISMLQTEPIVKWPKVTKRMIDRKKLEIN